MASGHIVKQTADIMDSVQSLRLDDLFRADSKMDLEGLDEFLALTWQPLANANAELAAKQAQAQPQPQPQAPRQALKVEIDADATTDDGSEAVSDSTDALDLVEPSPRGRSAQSKGPLSKTAAAPSKDKKRRRRNRLRSEKQQELNRLAQQRYRERKKQKYSDLQMTVEQLSQQREAALDKLEKAHLLLQQQNEELTAHMAMKDEQLATQKALIMQREAQLAEQRQLLEQRAIEVNAHAEMVMRQQRHIARLQEVVAVNGNAPAVAKDGSVTGGSSPSPTEVLAANVRAIAASPHATLADLKHSLAHVPSLQRALSFVLDADLDFSLDMSQGGAAHIQVPCF